MPFGLPPLLVALVVSLAANGLFFTRWMALRDDVAVANAATAQAVTDAKQCSEGVAALQKAADDRAKAAEDGRKVAEEAARTAQTKAQRLLAKAPTVPGNACASAQAQVDDWLAARRAK